MKYNMQLVMEFDYKTEGVELIKPKSIGEYINLIVLLERTATNSSYLCENEFINFTNEIVNYLMKAFDCSITKAGGNRKYSVTDINKLLAEYCIPYHVFEVVYKTGINKNGYGVKNYQYIKYNEV